MFRRSNTLSDPNLTMAVLKDRVCQAVETEIQNEITDFEITDEEYIDISSKFWERFYSCCEQYHIKSCQPIGLVVLDAVGAVCIVKKRAFSLLRPCDPLEQLMLSGDGDLNESEQFTALPLLVNDPKRCEDLVKLVSILAMLEHNILEDVKRDIHNKLYQLQIPNAVVETLVADMMSNEYDENVNFITFAIP